MGTNPVATFLATIFALQDPTTYKGSIDGNWAVARRYITAFAPHAQASPNMTVMLDAGFIFASGALTEVAAQSTAAITAPGGSPRIDRVVVDQTTGVVSVVTGTPAGSPVAPAIPAGTIPVAQVLLQTSSTVITNSMITDERILAGASAGLKNVQVFLTSGTYTRGAGVTKVLVISQAPGGGAGGSSNGPNGADGGAGETRIGVFSPGATEAVTIGTKGTGGAVGPNNGTDATDTSFGSWLTSKGGTKGIADGGAAGTTPTGTGGGRIDPIPAGGSSVHNAPGTMFGGGGLKTGSIVSGGAAIGYGGAGCCTNSSAGQGLSGGAGGPSFMIVVEF